LSYDYILALAPRRQKFSKFSSLLNLLECNNGGGGGNFSKVKLLWGGYSK